MITLITGLPGSGKSLFTLKTVKDLADKENRPVFYHGIPELTLDWQLMDKGEDWTECPKGAIIVIDECQTTFRPRANGATVPKHVSQLEVHRHDGHDLFLITQHPMLLDGNVRRLVGRHYHVVRFYGFQKSTIHEFQSVRENVKSLKDSMEKHFVYPKEVFGWYKSADMHTMKKRIPARLVLVIVLPLLLIALLVYAWITISGFSDHKIEDAKNQDKDGGLLNVQGILPMQPPPAQAQRLDWYAQQVERVPGLPHTKPAYDEITKPVTAPINAACVDFRGQCKCYSQQGTELNTDEQLCKQIIAKGFFIDFDPGQSVTERSQQADRDRILADRQRQEELARRDLERAASEARQGETVAPASVDVRQPQADEVRSPSKIARERTAASQWAFNPNQSN